MKYIELDEKEKDILTDFESGKMKFVGQISKYKKIAKNALNKTKNVNIRISEKDLQKVRSKAVKSGIPYQTLLVSLIHQYADDEFCVKL